MAEKRMFSKTIIDSDLFLDMPTSARLLYFDLSMRADDDGFVNNPKRITRMTGASDDDLRILITKQFIIPFETGIIVIKHWRLHNYIRKDTYTETVYQKEKAMLKLNDNKTYELVDSIPSTARGRLVDADKISIDKISIDKSTKFQKPSMEDINKYIKEKKLKVDAEYFYNYYESNGWKVGKNPMKNWKATLSNWHRRNNPEEQKKEVKDITKTEFRQLDGESYGEALERYRQAIGDKHV